jgi:hypothetical protein
MDKRVALWLGIKRALTVLIASIDEYMGVKKPNP